MPSLIQALDRWIPSFMKCESEDTPGIEVAEWEGIPVYWLTEFQILFSRVLQDKSDYDFTLFLKELTQSFYPVSQVLFITICLSHLKDKITISKR